MIRSRRTYNKIIADQSAQIADQRARIERLSKQVARLKDKIASLERHPGKKLDQQADS